MALSLPVILSDGQAFPDRHKLVAMTFGVIMFTLVVQGLTIEPLMKILRLNDQTTRKYKNKGKSSGHVIPNALRMTWLA